MHCPMVVHMQMHCGYLPLFPHPHAVSRVHPGAVHNTTECGPPFQAVRHRLSGQSPCLTEALWVIQSCVNVYLSIQARVSTKWLSMHKHSLK